MKKVIRIIFSILTTLIFLWGVLLVVDYVKGYVNEEKLIITLNEEKNDKYTKREGLGYTIVLHNYNSNNVKNGQVLKEFKIFGFVVNKEVAIVNYQ